jgi:hypothetical protein
VQQNGPDRDEPPWPAGEAHSGGSETGDDVRRRGLGGIPPLALIGLPLAGAVVGQVLSRLVSDDHPHDSVLPHPSGWNLGLALVLGIGGVALLVTGFMRTVKSNDLGEAWRSPITSLSFAERRELVDQMRGLQPLNRARLPLIRYLALRSVVQAQRTLRMSSGIIWCACAVLALDPPLVLAGIMVVLFASSLVQIVATGRQGRWAQAFLEAHPETGGASAT